MPLPRLSEAIRLGSMIRPQAFGVMHSGESTCALGAALEAVGVTAAADWFYLRSIEAIRERWPIGQLVIRIEVDRRAGNAIGPLLCTGTLDAVIVLLNDDHRWTRERIADFVASIEAQHPELAEPLPNAGGPLPSECSAHLVQEENSVRV